MTPMNVLIAIDGSDAALAAARCWAHWQGDAAALRIVLLNVAPPPPHFWAEPGLELHRIEEALLALGARQLAPARELFAATALAWESRTRVGVPAALIVEQAAEIGAELIVLGTRGVSGLRGLLVGSVALRVAQSSRVPVWLQPARATPPTALGRSLTALCPVDGSPNAERAMRWIGAQAPRFGDLAIELLSVAPARMPAESLLPDAPQRERHWSQRIGAAAIAAARSALPAQGPRVTTCVRSGDAIDEICRRADEIGADAIVMGTRGLGAVGQALLGSVSGGLLQTGTRTLILVP